MQKELSWTRQRISINPCQLWAMSFQLWLREPWVFLLLFIILFIHPSIQPFTIGLSVLPTRPNGTLPIHSFLFFVCVKGNQRLRYKQGLGTNNCVLCNFHRSLLIKNVAMVWYLSLHLLFSQKTHVPYRDSKMTRILQESLGKWEQWLFFFDNNTFSIEWRRKVNEWALIGGTVLHF